MPIKESLRDILATPHDSTFHPQLNGIFVFKQTRNEAGTKIFEEFCNKTRTEIVHGKFDCSDCSITFGTREGLFFRFGFFQEYQFFMERRRDRTV